MHPEHIRNGMPAAGLGPDGWRKPWSDNGGSCLEARKLPGGRVALRQSTDPDGPALILEPGVESLGARTRRDMGSPVHGLTCVQAGRPAARTDLLSGGST